jgi:hypothetical protein
MSLIHRGAHYDNMRIDAYLTLARSLPVRAADHAVNMIIRDDVALRLLSEPTTDKHYQLAVFVLIHGSAFRQAKPQAEQVVIYVAEHPDEFAPELAAQAARSISIDAD